MLPGNSSEEVVVLGYVNNRNCTSGPGQEGQAGPGGAEAMKEVSCKLPRVG